MLNNTIELVQYVLLTELCGLRMPHQAASQCSINPSCSIKGLDFGPCNPIVFSSNPPMQLIYLLPFATALFSGAFAQSTPMSNITARAPASFKHPGVLLSSNQLNFIRTKVKAGSQPWSDAYCSIWGSRIYRVLGQDKSHPL